MTFVVLSSDIPTKKNTIKLHESKLTNERFIIHDPDDIWLFVQPKVVKWLEQRLKESNEENCYQDPRCEDTK